MSQVDVRSVARPRQIHPVGPFACLEANLPTAIANNLDKLYSTTDAARLLGCAVNTISTWVARDKLTPYEHDERGRPLYRLGDLLTAGEETRRNALGGRWLL